MKKRAIIDQRIADTNPNGFSIEVDASLSERHNHGAELSKHPLETGDEVTDHARVLPLRLTMEGVISATSVNQSEVIRRSGAAGARVENGLGFYVGRQMDAFIVLLNQRRAVTIDTATKNYKDMVLTSLEFPRDARTGDALRFTATFEKVRFVETTVAQIDAPAIGTPKDPQKHGVRKDKGKASPSDVKNEGVKQDVTSVLKNGLNKSGLTSAGSGLR